MKVAKFTVSTILLVISFECFAVGPANLQSEIQGVSIFVTEKNADGYPTETLEGSSHELISHCASGKPIYILEIPGKSFQCKHQIIYGADKISILTKDKAAFGTVTVSTKDLSAKRFKVEPLSPQELASLSDDLTTKRATLRKDEVSDFICENPGKFCDKQYREHLREITQSTQYKTKRSLGVKVLTDHKVFAIAEVGIRTNALGWDFRSAVFDLTGNAPAFVGEFDGCIDGFADIDQDGIPEIKTSLCENNEGESDSYLRIFPKFKLGVVSRYQ